MTVDLNRIGYGQVEPNHLSGQWTREFYAQLPANSDIAQLENGQFAKYDAPAGEVNFTGEGEWLLVWNEIKLYKEWEESYKDFALVKDNYTPGGNISHYGVGPFNGQMTPRLMATKVGDIMTTNCICSAGTKGAKTNYGTKNDIVMNAAASKTDSTVLTKLKYWAPNSSGYLDVLGTKPTSGMVWKLIKIYELADGQPAFKLQRIQ